MTIWDQRYSKFDYLYGKAPNDFLVQTARHLPPGPVLCLADGEGRNGVYLAELGYAVTSVDGSAVGLQKARQLAAERGVSLTTEVADLRDYPIVPESWGSIVSIFCHLPPLVRETVHQRCVAGLVSGGVFLLEAYTPAQIPLKTGGPPTASLAMTLDQLQSELAGLEFWHGTELERDIHEGSLHNGRSAVVQVLAVKP